jgi:hypothetical protein
MKNRSKILTFGLIVLIIFTGVIYAQNQKSAEEPNDKFEITEKKEESSDLEKSEQPEEEIKTESDVSTELTEENTVQESEEPDSKSQNAETESAAKDSAPDSADRNAGMVEFEELIAAHPETKEIYADYQADKEQLAEGENKEENLEKLNKTYTNLIIEKTRSDLEDFAEAEELDLLVVNDQLVLGEKEEEEELPELENKSEEFKDFLNN